MKLTDLKISALGIGGIVILEGIALLKGVDGTMFGSSMAAIGAVVGWTMREWHRKNRRK